MLQFETQQERQHKEVRRHIECCMETGNFNAARTALDEYEAINPEGGRNIRAFITKEYGTGL